jgi:hypothetical protein
VLTLHRRRSLALRQVQSKAFPRLGDCGDRPLADIVPVTRV